jgi:diguanylate cyclase (GGDEF)-like protein
MLEKMALMDNLTGLYNRHYLLAVLDSMEIENPEDCWIAMLDIDNFKKVNDTYGHNCGDYILREVAGYAHQTCDKCTVCRWGGEEFIILSAKSGCSTDILETLRKKIEDEEFHFEDSTLKITVTIGASAYSGDISNDAWISNADEKLYYGKTNGKNQVVL